MKQPFRTSTPVPACIDTPQHQRHSRLKQKSILFSISPILHAPSTLGENHAHAFTAPRPPFDIFGPSLPRPEPVQTLVTSFAKGVDFRLYRLNKTSTQIYETERMLLTGNLSSCMISLQTSRCLTVPGP